MEQEADWIWVSDDDAYLKDDALKQASDYLEEQPDLDKISAICGKVIKNGKMDINHGKYYYKKGIRICEASIPAEMYEKKEFEMGSFTYVGTIMNKKKLLEAGLPNKDYFIYCPFPLYQRSVAMRSLSFPHLGTLVSTVRNFNFPTQKEAVSK